MYQKKEIFCFLCDNNKNSGEGILARLFLKNLEKNYNIKIKKIKNNKFLFYNNYIIPFLLIFKMWFYYLNKKKIAYINYLPMWNTLIFLLLPPNTIIGPITGGALFKKNNVRKFILPIFYFISEKIIFLRYRKVIFSTSLLKKYISKNNLKNSYFNFVFKEFKKNNINYKKNIDFLLYYRNHKNKKKFFNRNNIKFLINYGFKIHIVGDNPRIPGLIYHGNIQRWKLNFLLKKTKYTIITGENIFSFFIIDAINNNVKVFSDKINKNFYVNHSLNFINIDFKNFKFDLLKNIKLHER